jgi:hypothetical protein
VVSGGHVARDGHFAFRVKGITCGYAAAQAVHGDPDVTGAKPAGTTECIVRLRVTDDKGEAQTFFDSDQYAYDARGGALHSPGGRAVIALPSWHPRADVSTIVPQLTDSVTSFQHSFIVSEQGTAAVWGHDAVTQAGQIIDQVAHPSARDALREAGRGLGFRLS